MKRIILLLFIALHVAACVPSGKPGEACTASGEGFQREDSCEDMCVSWAITCEDGTTVVPDVCAGRICGTGTACDTGDRCTQVDSFPDNARCMSAKLCVS